MHAGVTKPEPGSQIVALNQKPTSNKRQREQDQKDRAAERVTRRHERKTRAAARQAAGMVGPEIAEAPPPDVGGDVEGAPERAPAAPAAERAGTGSRRLYVGNLPYDIDSDALRAMFAEKGEVADVHMVLDHATRRPRGFAFVVMGSSTQAQQAIAEFDGRNVGGRTLRVSEADGREPGRGGGGDRSSAPRGRF